MPSVALHLDRTIGLPLTAVCEALDDSGSYPRWVAACRRVDALEEDRFRVFLAYASYHNTVEFRRMPTCKVRRWQWEGGGEALSVQVAVEAEKATRSSTRVVLRSCATGDATLLGLRLDHPIVELTLSIAAEHSATTLARMFGPSEEIEPDGGSIAGVNARRSSRSSNVQHAGEQAC